ncbi:hypothetical protein [Bacteroides cellulosilyticus]|jgi:hypothetical protein|uniref:hypothetical protein n=1 Tax=Bacteroides cellulosilyticus TaxID=246787 RepID=UPI001898B896|nr:hypothetical protein [Bacteroides cellulosilyticus]
MTIKLSSFANIKSAKGCPKVSFKSLSPHKEAEFLLYLYKKGIRCYGKKYYYEDDGREIDGGELLSLIEGWLPSDLEIDSEYENFITAKDVLNAMHEIKFPVMNQVAIRILTTGQSDYNPDYEHDGVIACKNREIKCLVAAIKEKDNIIKEKENIIQSLKQK